MSRSKSLLSSQRLLGPAGECIYTRGYQKACGDGSMLMSFERVSVLYSQYPHGGSKPSVTLVPEDSKVFLFLTSEGIGWSYIYAGKY